MSRLLELPRGLHKSSRDKFLFEPFFSGISRLVGNDEALQILDQSTTDSKNRSNTQRYSSGTRTHITNSTGSKYDAKNLIPLPDWPVALSRWGLCWDFHIYGFCGLYLMLTVVSAVIFLRFRLRVHRIKIVFNTLILLATSGVFRLVFLLVDPYGYKGNMAGLMVGVMTQAVYPLFCACYGMTQVTVFRITKLDAGHNRLRTLSCLLGCTLSYLFLVVVIETLVFYERSLKLLLLLDSGCFIVWSLCLGITFICSGFRLTQYTTDSRKANKELNIIGNHRSSTSNATGFSAISSSTTYDNSTNVFSVDLSSTTLDPLTVITTRAATPDVSFSGASVACFSPTFPISDPSFQTTDQHSDSSAHITRLGPKVSSHDHMIIALATDDDDKSTSSTDIDRPRTGNITKRKRTRKRHRQKHALIKSKSRSPTLPSVFNAATVAVSNSISKEPLSSSRIRHKPSHNDQKKVNEVASINYTSLSGSDIQNYQQTISATECEVPASQSLLGEHPHKISYTFLPSTELPLLSPSDLSVSQIINSSKNNIHESVDDDCVDYNRVDEYDDNDKCKNDTQLAIYRSKDNLVCLSQENPSPARSLIMETDLILTSKDLSDTGVISLKSNNCPHDAIKHAPLESNKWPHDAIKRVPLLESNECVPEALNSIDSTVYSAPSDNDQTRENGYLADTENAISCSASARLRSLKRQRLSNHRVVVSCDTASQRSSSFSSSGGSTASQELSDRRSSNLSDSSCPLSVKQSNMIQGAIYLTYILTFLFLFACLLQLYTLFGVYGVLGTIPVPDPWPWLIFQSLFRLTEVSIGFTIAAIGFIALSHRHQRTKRRHQQHQEQQPHLQEQQPHLQEQQPHLQEQQPNLEDTGDCIV